MALFTKRSPWEKEWDNLIKKEEKFKARRMDGPTCAIISKLDRFVPEKLSNTLNAAFFKGFQVIFEKGTGVIEKTYNKDKRENQYQINKFASELNSDSKSAKMFTKQAKSTKKINLLASSLEGVGLGLVGAGIPDIPLFIAMVLKSVYEIALSYGYRYDTDEEKVFLLRIIQVAMLDEKEFVRADEDMNELIDEIIYNGDSMENMDWLAETKEDQMKATSQALSNEMIYTKFLQGQFIIGIAGGIFDPIYVNRISDYAVLKYRRRFLKTKLG